MTVGHVCCPQPAQRTDPPSYLSLFPAIRAAVSGSWICSRVTTMLWWVEHNHPISSRDHPRTGKRPYDVCSLGISVPGSLFSKEGGNS